MKFAVLSAVKFRGKVYPEGSVIETDAKGASELPAHCVREVAEQTKNPSAKQATASEQKKPLTTA